MNQSQYNPTLPNTNISIVPADRDDINAKMSRMSIENIYDSPMINKHLPFQFDTGRKTDYKSSINNRINDKFSIIPPATTDNRLFDTMHLMERFSSNSRTNNYRDINNDRLNNLNLTPCTTAIPIIKNDNKAFFNLMPADTRQS